MNIIFKDLRLQEAFSQCFAALSKTPDDLRTVGAILDAVNWFELIEGRGSPAVKEGLAKLAMPELRSALKKWYRLSGKNMNGAAIEIRARLEAAIGEDLSVG